MREDEYKLTKEELYFLNQTILSTVQVTKTQIEQDLEYLKYMYVSGKISWSVFGIATSRLPGAYLDRYTFSNDQLEMLDERIRTGASEREIGPIDDLAGSIEPVPFYEDPIFWTAFIAGGGAKATYQMVDAGIEETYYVVNSWKIKALSWLMGGNTLSFSTGKAAEEYMAQRYGGIRQKYFMTSLGKRFLDLLSSDGIARESKVGYTCLTEFAKKQVLKDAELIANGFITGAEWHFYRSQVTDLVGASQPLLDFLTQHGIKYIIHK